VRGLRLQQRPCFGVDAGGGVVLRSDDRRVLGQLREFGFVGGEVCCGLDLL